MEKKSKKSLVIGITSLFLVMLILVGLTYAYYRTRVIGNENETSISVQSKKMEITYHDGSAVLSTEGLIEPGFTATKEFSVENTGTETSTYSIILDNVVNEYNKDTERGEYNDWKYYLYSGSVVNPSNLIKEGEITTDTVQYIVESVSINAEETKNYILKVEYKDLEDIDQSLDMGSKFSIRVNIGDEYEVEYTWDKAPSGTLLYALRTNQPTGTEETIPGQAASTENETRIVETEDDYGTSYVYRGKVTNNYVNFSGMCWRVLRVQGDGTIKLILADEKGECNSETYSLENDKSAYINDEQEYDLSSPYSKVGFYPEGSEVISALNSWKNSKLDATKLVESDWCIDMSVSEAIDMGDDFDDWLHYGTSDRLRKKTPILKCNHEGFEVDGVQTKSVKYKNNIGMMTVDEIVFAGIYGYKSSTYISDNAQHYVEGTFSLSEYNSEVNLIFPYFVGYGKTIESGQSLATVVGVIRPAIVLRYDVMLSTNTSSTQVGTYQNPYVID